MVILLQQLGRYVVFFPPLLPPIPPMLQQKYKRIVLFLSNSAVSFACLNTCLLVTDVTSTGIILCQIFTCASAETQLFLSGYAFNIAFLILVLLLLLLRPKMLEALLEIEQVLLLAQDPSQTGKSILIQFLPPLQSAEGQGTSMAEDLPHYKALVVACSVKTVHANMPWNIYNALCILSL